MHNAMIAWAQESLNLANINANALPGDAGMRTYIRLSTSNQSWLAVNSDLQTLQVFSEKQRFLQALGIAVPMIAHSEVTQGWMLQTDLGIEPLSAHTTLAHDDHPRYQMMMSDLMRLQCTPLHQVCWPHFSYDFMTQECNLFVDWWAEGQRNQPLTQTERHDFDSVCARLIGQALGQPQVLMHRDFISRNLMCHAQKVYWIDFQDACIGPLFYDIASLLSDPLPACHPSQHKPIWQAYLTQLKHHWHQDPLPSNETLNAWLDWTILQRQIKILGIFSRLDLRDQKPHYLANAETTLISTIHDITQRHAFCAPLWQIIQRRLCKHSS